ncbi:MAG: hypothetical protein BWY79_01321 [Actinobacteria bacterium ADurb.Bin444]|nr:MAG: hypothetical protein BWY79_01321 [Actinobacteria bacterium ADurb.Bin444]
MGQHCVTDTGQCRCTPRCQTGIEVGHSRGRHTEDGHAAPINAIEDVIRGKSGLRGHMLCDRALHPVRRLLVALVGKT